MLLVAQKIEVSVRLSGNAGLSFGSVSFRVVSYILSCFFLFLSDHV